jgi:hypothetical protein
MTRLELPQDPDLAVKVVDAQSRQVERRIEMGLIGRLFGSVQDKPGNIAGTAVVVSLIVLLTLFFTSYFYPNTHNAPIGELMALFGSIITLALGYLFGKGTS